MSERVNWRRALQAFGFLVGIGLLVWCVSVALSEKNREQFDRLMDASAWQVTVLLACSAGTMILNGLIFWVLLWPVERTNVLYMSAVNGLATLISYAPFKIALAFRVLVHRRIDKVPVLTIGAWFAAIAVVTVAVVGPAIGASFAVRGGSAAWWAMWIGGSIALTAASIAIASAFQGQAGWEKLKKLLAGVGLGAIVRWLGTEHGLKIHAGVDMIAHRRATSAASGLRVADILVQAVRIRVAAEILGVELDWGGSMVIASTYFLIGILSPIGMLGTREAGSAGMAALAGVHGPAGAESILLVSLLVSASEAIVNLAGGGLGAGYLRVDKWLLGRNGRETQIKPIEENEA